MSASKRGDSDDMSIHDQVVGLVAERKSVGARIGTVNVELAALLKAEVWEDLKQHPAADDLKLLLGDDTEQINRTLGRIDPGWRLGLDDVRRTLQLLEKDGAVAFVSCYQIWLVPDVHNCQGPHLDYDLRSTQGEDRRIQYNAVCTSCEARWMKYMIGPDWRRVNPTEYTYQSHILIQNGFKTLGPSMGATTQAS